MKKIISAIYVIGCLLCTVCTPLSAIFIICKLCAATSLSWIACCIPLLIALAGFTLAYNYKSDYQHERKIGGKNAETKQK